MSIEKEQLPRILAILHHYGVNAFAQGIAEILISNPTFSLYDIAIAWEKANLPTYFAARPIDTYPAIYVGMHPVTKKETQDVLRFCASRQELVDVLADIWITEAENLERLKTAWFLSMRDDTPSLS